MTKTHVAVGRKVPDFSAVSTAGAFRLKDARGANLLLYFYPRDSTSGCTKEGIAFGALGSQFKKAGTVILGVSPDTLASHEKFRAKYAFPFHLLVDTDKALCTLFDVIREKTLYGKRYMGVERSSFLIDAHGVLRHEWRKVKVEGHAAEVLAVARAL